MTNNLENKNIYRVLFIALLPLSLLLSISYVYEDYFSTSVISLFGITLIFYVKNYFNFRNLLHSCKYL